MRRKLENLESWFGNLENTGNTRVREFLSIKKTSDWRLMLLTFAVWTGIEPKDHKKPQQFA